MKGCCSLKMTLEEYLNTDYDQKIRFIPVYKNGKSVTKSVDNYQVKDAGFIAADNSLELLRSEVKKNSPQDVLTRAEKKEAVDEYVAIKPRGIAFPPAHLLKINMHPVTQNLRFPAAVIWKFPGILTSIK